MNYKLNQVDIKCDQEISDELSMVRVGQVNDNISVFNASECCRSIGVPTTDYRVFTKFNKQFIDWIVEYRGIKNTELFYVTPAQDLLINTCLMYTYLQFISKDIYIYFSSLIEDVVHNGIAFSDTTIISQAIARIPKDILKQLAEDE